MRFISRVLRTQKGEGRLAALVVALMFVAMAAFTIGQSGIDALFFDRVGAQALPVMYLLQGGRPLARLVAIDNTANEIALSPARSFARRLTWLRPRLPSRIRLFGCWRPIS
jgi:hypothetical protein